MASLDEVIEGIAEQAVEYALHAGNTSLSERDIAMAVEDVLGSQWRVPRWVLSQPQAQGIVKRPTLAASAHSSRMALIKKDMAALAASHSNNKDR